MPEPSPSSIASSSTARGPTPDPESTYNTPLRPSSTHPLARSSSVHSLGNTETATPLLASNGGGTPRKYHPGCPLCSLIASLPDNPSPSSSNPTYPSNPNVRRSNEAGPSRLSDISGSRNLDVPSSPPGSATSATFLTPQKSTASYSAESGRRSPGLGSSFDVSTPTRAKPQELPVTVAGKEVIHFDDDITVYKAKGKERMTEEGKHLIILLNRHHESVYELGPSDVPTLSHMLDTAYRLLSSYRRNGDVERGPKQNRRDIRVGFVGNMIKDPYSSCVHLHAHAMIGPVDNKSPGATFYRRNVVFGSLNWWSIEDLRAEIREESSNNRVKSGYEDRDKAPIDSVPDAGSRAGLPNALDPDPYRDKPPSGSSNTNSGQNLRRGRTGKGRADEREVEPRDNEANLYDTVKL